jgi:hypothetical protein
MSYAKWFALACRASHAALVAYVVAHHEGASLCQWPRSL